MTLNAGAYQNEAIRFPVAKGTSAGVTKGDILSLSSNKWVTAPTSAKGPFVVALETKATAATSVLALFVGRVALTADGTVEPNNPIMISAATAGQFIKYVETAISGSVTQADVLIALREHKVKCGFYIGHENEDGSTIATDALDGEVVWCYFNGGGY